MSEMDEFFIAQVLERINKHFAAQPWAVFGAECPGVKVIAKSVDSLTLMADKNLEIFSPRFWDDLRRHVAAESYVYDNSETSCLFILRFPNNRRIEWADYSVGALPYQKSPEGFRETK